MVKEYSDLQQRQQAFWNEFLLECPKELLGRKKPQLANDPEVLNFASAPGYTELRGILSEFDGRSLVRIQFRFRDEKGWKLYQMLKNDEAAIASDFGVKIEWHDNPGKNRKRFFVEREIGDLMNKADWPSHFEWIVTLVRKMQSIIQPRIDNFVESN